MKSGGAGAPLQQELLDRAQALPPRDATDEDVAAVEAFAGAAGGRLFAGEEPAVAGRRPQLEGRVESGEIGLLRRFLVRQAEVWQRSRQGRGRRGGWRGEQAVRGLERSADTEAQEEKGDA